MTESWNVLSLFAQVNIGFPDASVFAIPALGSMVWTVVILVLKAVINITFALAVLSDANRRQTFLVGSFIWALATLLGGVFVAGIYWAIHHSNLQSQR